MIKKFIVWHKLNNGLYQIKEYSNRTMLTLAFFLNDGLPFELYINFLKNENQQEFQGNISLIEKKENIVIISMDDYVYPNMPSFKISIDNLIKIIEEYSRLYFLGVNRIEISLNNGIVTIEGK